jgi:acyl carrier protein
MNESDYRELCEIVARVIKIDSSEVSLDSSIDDLGGDSLHRVEIIMALEARFKLSIPDDFTNSYTSVEDLAKFIQDNT